MGEINILDPDNQLPEIDECKYLILKLIEQAVRDYLSLQYSTAPIEQFFYRTAYHFIFDDEYLIDYGDTTKSLSDLLDVLDIDTNWFRSKVSILKEKRVREFKIRGILYGKYRR